MLVYFKHNRASVLAFIKQHLIAEDQPRYDKLVEEYDRDSAMALYAKSLVSFEISSTQPKCDAWDSAVRNYNPAQLGPCPAEHYGFCRCRPLR